jgi:very-short-patch-repair endonuclease
MQQSRAVWALVMRQHGVISRVQLFALGYSAEAIDHRVEKGRLTVIFRGVYAVGRPEVSRIGFLMAAVLASGEGAALSHASAAELWGIRGQTGGAVHVTTPRSRRGARGIRLHRRKGVEVVRRQGIPVTTIVDTLIDIRATEADVNEADKLDLIHVGPLRRALETMPARPGLATLQRMIDRHTFRLTDSELERYFMPIAFRVGYPRPRTRVWISGYRFDFYFEELGIAVEADGGRFHRTPMQQTADRRREHVLLKAKILPVRFTHGQIYYAPHEVEEALIDAKNWRVELTA